MNRNLVQYLSTFVTPARLDLFDRMLEQRTRYLTVVLENVFQPQNASAVVRTADCFGLQDLYVIENGNRFTVDREIAMGASKWIDLKKFNGEENNTQAAIDHLRDKGYRIVATSPHEGSVNLENFNLGSGKAALFLGTELTGISNVVKKNADEFLSIPMYGFTESLNISVSAAIILHYLTHQMRFHSDVAWHLTPAEKTEVKLSWLRHSIKNSPMIEERFFKTADMVFADTTQQNQLVVKG